MIPELSLAAWALLALAAVIIGVSKTALPGAGILAITAFAMVLPARTSTGAILLLLLLGDAFAVFVYRRHAHWPTLLKLAPAVLGGLLLGFAFLAVSGDSIVRRAIGVILIVMIGITLWHRRRKAQADAGTGRVLATTYGALGGFTTMVANAGGPVMSMYFLANRTSVHVFLGTSAWFFAIVNVVKVPFLAGIGLINGPVLLMDLALAPFVVIGAFIGLRVAARINQKVFDAIVIGLTFAGAVYLLF